MSDEIEKMLGDSDEQVDIESYRLLTMYAEGVHIADIAKAFGWASPLTVYRHLKQFPENYKEAKAKLLEKRNAKYRRAGALAIDIQIEALENATTALARESELLQELERLQLESIEYDYDTRLIDLTTGKINNDELRLKITKHNRRIEQIQAELEYISHIRSSIKDFKDVGESAEKRADLNEGKPTERREDINRPMTVEELEALLQKVKNAGTGLDKQSMGM